MREEFGIRVPLVILPVDSFTGKGIKDPGFLVCVEGAGRPVVKPEGYRVFTEVPGMRVAAELRGHTYQSVRAEINLAALPPGRPVAVVRVLPGKDYPFPENTAFLEGELPEHAIFSAAAVGDMAERRLRLDCAAGDKTIAVYQEARQNPAWTTYLITGKNGGKEEQEWIELKEALDVERGIYALKEPLRYSHSGREAVLSPAVRCEADAAGRHYFIARPVKAEGKELFFRCRTEADGKRVDEIFPASWMKGG